MSIKSWIVSSFLILILDINITQANDLEPDDGRVLIRFSSLRDDDIWNDERTKIGIFDTGQTDSRGPNPPFNYNELVALNKLKTPPGVPVYLEKPEDRGKWALYRSGLVIPNPIFDAAQEQAESHPNEASPYKELGNLLVAAGRLNLSQVNERLSSTSGDVLATQEAGGLFFNQVMSRNGTCFVIPSVFASTVLGFLSANATVPISTVSFGNTFGWPVGSVGSQCILAGVMGLSMVPYSHEYVDQFASLFKDRTQDAAFNTLRIEKELKHKGAYGFVFLTSLLRAMVRSGFLYGLESGVSGGKLFFSFVVAPSAISELMWQYKVGKADVDHTLYKGYTRDVLSTAKRDIIRKGIENFRMRVDTDSLFCQRIYDKLRVRIFNTYDPVDLFTTRYRQEILALTGFVLVYGLQRYDDLAIGLDFNTIQSPSAGATYYSYLRDATFGIACLGTTQAISTATGQYMLGSWFGPSKIVTYASQAIGGLFAMGRLLLKPQASAKPYSSVLPSRYSNYRKQRYIGRLGSIANSGLHLWWLVYMAAQGADKCSPNYVYLGTLLSCLGVHEFASYDDRFNGQTQDAITDIYLRKMDPNNPTIDGVRNLLGFLCTKFTDEIDSFKPGVIDAFYNTAFLSHVDLKG